MKLNWQELKSYYNKGVLNEIIAKLGLTASDILDAVYEQVSWYEGEIEELEKEIVILESYKDKT